MHAHLPGVDSYTLHGRLDRLQPMVVSASFGLKKIKKSEILWNKPAHAAQEDLIQGNQTD